MVKCCVDGCKITSKKDVTYFKFPASRSQRLKWEAALKLSGKKLNGASVCSQHFTDQDYDLVRGKMRLKAAVVPSVLGEEVKNNSNTNNIPTNEDSTETEEDFKDLSPERENDRDPDKDRTESNDSPMNHTSSEDRTLDTTDDPLKEVSPTRESSPEKDRISNQETTLETDKEIDKETFLNETNGEMEIEEENVPKDKLDPQKDISKDLDPEKEITKDKIESDVKNSCESSVNNNLNSSSSKPSDNNKKLSVTEKENTEKREKAAKAIDSTDNKDGNGSIDENQDIEELLTDYRIYHNNIQRVENEIVVEVEPLNEVEVETYEDLPCNVDPVFIELAVDKESANDCLMVLESVQVEIDPSTLLQNQEFEVASDDLDGDDDDDEVELKDVKESQGPKEPISLLTSSDEDDVIIQEPKIDTVEVSDETDEDDKPLVQLVKKKKKKVKRKRTTSEENFKRIMWGMYEYFCVECNFRSHSKSEYTKHKQEHINKVLLMCQLCGYMTSSEPQLAKHEKQHKDFKKYQCNLCDYKAKHNMSLVYHMRAHKEVKKTYEVKKSFEAKKNHTCFKCGYKSVNESESVRHVLLCKGVGSKRHCCDKCDYRTSKPSDLKRHKSRKHKESDSEDEYIP